MAYGPGWLGFASSHAPLCLWLSAMGDELFVAAFSQGHVAHGLENQGIKMTNPLPDGAVAARSVTNVPDPHQMVRHAFQLSRSLPDEPLQRFKKQTASLPQNTEVERLVIQRMGQDILRDRLMDITIDDDGAVVISSSLSDQDRAILGFYETLRVRPGWPMATAIIYRGIVTKYSDRDP